MPISPPTAVIVNTGVANTASVAAALSRLNIAVTLSTDPKTIDATPLLILPGVGTFAAGIETLRQNSLEKIITQRIADDRPTLLICLGLQLLATSSDESPHTQGLGIIDAHVTRFPPTVRVPQFGWNSITPDPAATLLTPGDAYFANSFRLTHCPPGWHAAWADHGGPFIAALQRSRILACQFHPELSSRFGSELLHRWLALSAQELSQC
ncbi:MAG: imidazole glycerol phosphate synthase subunit HisH [Phycisphaeraceae bacterium]|nr:imidazole glycerol phosphate synthase subunit HisH [Phycisphaeraceae bacterium]MCW5763966.1 imidazole glycerol phosphate synthase subunit HisH [Phycisphaeraceae bacterium]